jgi:hypothetical protein
MNSELERIWKEADVALFMEVYRHLPGRTEEENKKTCQDSPSVDRFEPMTSQI